MFCSKCGSPNNDGAAFCAKCGAALGTAGAGGAGAATSSPEHDDDARPSQRGIAHGLPARTRPSPSCSRSSSVRSAPASSTTVTGRRAWRWPQRRWCSVFPPADWSRSASGYGRWSTRTRSPAANGRSGEYTRRGPARSDRPPAASLRAPERPAGARRAAEHERPRDRRSKVQRVGLRASASGAAYRQQHQSHRRQLSGSPPAHAARLSRPGPAGRARALPRRRRRDQRLHGRSRPADHRPHVRRGRSV